MDNAEQWEALSRKREYVDRRAHIESLWSALACHCLLFIFLSIIMDFSFYLQDMIYNKNKGLFFLNANAIEVVAET